MLIKINPCIHEHELTCPINMNHLTIEILASWMLSSYKYIICTVSFGQINVQPVFHESKIEFENTFLLPINDEVITKAAMGRAILGWKFLCDTSDIE